MTGLYKNIAGEIQTTLDVHFSRRDRKIAICPFDETDAAGVTRSHMPTGAVPDPPTWPFTQGDCIDPNTSTCITYDVECPDLDPWPETDVDTYLKNQSVLSWYGWF